MSKKANYLDGYEKEFCNHCQMKRTENGHDPCIGELSGVMNACCGHGETDMAYVQFNHSEYKEEPNKILLQGEKALKYIKQHSSVGLFTF